MRKRFTALPILLLILLVVLAVGLLRLVWFLLIRD
jgi:hypothetical protein